jgi:hypothetical protein
MDGRRTTRRLPELSNFYCLPGRAGGSPLVISRWSSNSIDPDANRSGFLVDEQLGQKVNTATLLGSYG